MKVLKSLQTGQVSDAVLSKISMTVPVLEATLFSLSRERVERFGGIDKLRLSDLSREYREGDGDVGICFEYAIHDQITTNNPLIGPIASEILEDFCKISGGAGSILFGPEKDGVIPILESTQDSLTDDSIVFLGDRGRPPKLKQHIPRIIQAFHQREERNKLPRSIRGLWKADLFVGNAGVDKWVGTTVKINSNYLEAAEGLRIAIYPRKNEKDVPRKDEKLNLIRLPLHYDASFVELFYKAFNLARAFLRADGRVPPPVDLPDAEDRFVTKELQDRRDFPLLDVLEALRKMGHPSLLSTAEQPDEIEADASLSEDGLEQHPKLTPSSNLVSLAPYAAEET